MSITGNGDEDKEEDKSEGAKVHPLTMYSGGGSSPVMDISCTLLDRNDIFAKRRDIKLLSVNTNLFEKLLAISRDASAHYFSVHFPYFYH